MKIVDIINSFEISDYIAFAALILSVFTLYKSRRHFEIDMTIDNINKYTDVSETAINNPIKTAFDSNIKPLINPYKRDHPNGKFCFFKCVTILVSNNSPNKITVQSQVLLDSKNNSVNIACLLPFISSNNIFFSDDNITLWSTKTTEDGLVNMTMENITLYSSIAYSLDAYETKIFKYALIEFENIKIPEEFHIQVYTTLKRNFFAVRLVKINNFIVSKLRLRNQNKYLRLRDPYIKDKVCFIRS